MKKLIKLCLGIILSLSLTACSNSANSNKITDMISSSYKIETGDIITISIPSGYEQIETVPFTINKNNKLVCEGNFTSEISTKKYLEAVSDEAIVENKKINQNEFLLIKEDTEYNGFIFVSDSDTVVTLNFNLSREEIKDFVGAINISLRAQ